MILAPRNKAFLSGPKKVFKIHDSKRGVQGPAGPKGEPGITQQDINAAIALARYEHLQSTPSVMWTINHNLGRKPLVSVFSPGGLEIICEVLHNGLNQVYVYFDSPQSGSAVCA